MSVSYPPSYRQKRSAAELVAERARAAGTPFSAMVEIADRCNEACVHCYQVQGAKGELGTEQWERIFRELADLGVLFLTISGGEATLRKDFLHLVAYARSLRFAVRIFSNGLRLTPEMAAELGRLAVQEVQLSLYSPRPAAHDAVTRVPGSFERIIAAAGDLRAAGVRVLLKTPLMSDNAPDYAEYVELAAALGADYMFDPKLMPREDGDLSPTTLGASRAALLAVRRDARIAKRTDRVRPDRSLSAAPCGACRSNVHIEPNGELRPCTLWNVPTGHVQDGPLRDAWYENPSARAIRSLTWNDLPACKRCDLRPYCQRCFSEAESYTGDALAPYAAACSGARWKYEAEQGRPAEIDAAGGSVSVPPIGPFEHVGEHRFTIGEQVTAPAASGPAPQPRRPWLPAAAAPAPASGAGLVQLRRSRALALTPDAAAPSERRG